MRGGHNRKTIAQHRAEGTYQRIRHGDPEDKVEFPECDAIEPPEALSDGARKEWFRILPALREAGLLTQAYRTTITRYCVLAAEAEEDPSGFTKDTQLRQYIQSLGLSPQAAGAIGNSPKGRKKGGKFDDI